MENDIERKRTGENCDYLCKKRFKNSTDDQDSESRSLGSCSGTTSSSPRDSGFRETVIRSSSGDDSASFERDELSKGHKKLSSRVRILEQKVGWIGSELRLIRQMLEFITRVIPNDSMAQISVDKKRENITKNLADTIATKGSFLNLLPNTSAQSFAGGCEGSSKEKGLTRQMTEDSKRSPSNFGISLLKTKSAGDFRKEDENVGQEQQRNECRSIFVSRNDGNSETNTKARHSSASNGNKVADLYSILPETLSAVDIIHLWEFGTTDILPIKLWSKEELTRGGERISIWQQIITLFNEECNRNLRTFICKYSTANGDVMSVPEIIARSQLGRKSSSNSVSADYQRAKEITLSHSVADQQTNGETSKIPNQDDNLNESKSLLYILPRKLNGSKISAKDVIRIWENGHGRIPPVKSWTPNQKLRQQSKISRWKKIVDIYNNDCACDMKIFESRYSNECGVLLPIATIISKYEQQNTSHDEIHQPTMSSINQSSYDESQRSNSWQPVKLNLKPMGFPVDKTALLSHSAISKKKCTEKIGSQQANLFFQGSSWKERMNSYSKEEFCREYINSHMSESAVTCHQTNKDDKEPAGCSNERESSDEIAESSMPEHEKHATLSRYVKMNDQKFLSAMTSPFLTKAADAKGNPSVKNSNLAEGIIITSCSDVIQEVKPIPTSIAYLRSEIEKPLSVEHNSDRHLELPDTSDAFEVISLWENGNNMFPPIRLMTRQVVDSNPKLSLWKKFMDIFHYDCNSERNVLLRKFSDRDGNLLPVVSIVQHFHNQHEQKQQQMKVYGAAYHNKMFDFQSGERINESKVGIIYTLPRKINGRKVSAKDVISIWSNGFKDIPPVGSWLPQQKIRQQSKISRWKKIVEIFENDCGGDMQVFEKKYSTKTNELLPIATIISKYELEKEDNGTTTLNSTNNSCSYTF